MERTINDGYLDVYNRISSKNTAAHSFLYACIDRGNKFLRNCSSDSCINKGIPCARCLRLKFKNTMTILTVTAGLTYKTTFCSDCFTDCLLVSNLRSADIGLNLKLTEQTVNDDVKVKLTHSGNDRLSCFLISIGAETVSYTHLRAHETDSYLVCRLLLEKK